MNPKPTGFSHFPESTERVRIAMELPGEIP
jgi:hypothetical protein